MVSDSIAFEALADEIRVLERALNPDLADDAAVEALHEHHDALRMRFREGAAGWEQRNEGVGAPASFLVMNALLLGLLEGVPQDSFLAWGWRIPFFLGVVLGLAYLWHYRRVVEDDSVYAERRTEIRRQPLVVLFTEHRLQLDGPGVQVAPLGADGDRYRFQYSGIRTLIRTKQALLLIPVGWQRGSDRVFVVPDDGSSRVDIIAPPLPQKAPARTG